MYYKKNGKWYKTTKKKWGIVSPSVLATRRAAFERKKLTAAFRSWRVRQYKQKQKGLCYYCKKPIIGAWSTDHVIPLYRGGTSAYSNLVVCCIPCNKDKGIRIGYGSGSSSDRVPHHRPGAPS